MHFSFVDRRNQQEHLTLSPSSLEEREGGGISSTLATKGRWLLPFSHTHHNHKKPADHLLLLPLNSTQYVCEPTCVTLVHLKTLSFYSSLWPRKAQKKGFAFFERRRRLEVVAFKSDAGTVNRIIRFLLLLLQTRRGGFGK